MCGGGSVKKLTGGITKVSTLGLTDNPIEAVTLGTVKAGKEGVEVLGQTVVPGIPELPPVPEGATPEELKGKAAAKAAAEILERRRRIAKGGRKSTLLAGAEIAQQEQLKKTLLGQ
jgi:hypothetical protein